MRPPWAKGGRGEVDQPGAGPDFVDPSALLSRRFWAGLALVALLVLLDRLVVQPPLARLATDAPLINEAGRQRMLSQRLSKAALALTLAAEQGDGRAEEHWRTELRAVLAAWSSAHERLRQRSQDAGVRAEFAAIEPSYARMRGAAEQIATTETPPARRAGVRAILGAEADFLPRMERIVGLYETAARARVQRLIATAWAIAALALAALAGIGGFIFRPATQLIARQFHALRAARDALEDRVRARTAELENANRSLAHEAEKRARAEQRQRTLLEQLSRATRTNTIGEMASGLAHELNQPLGAIANYAEGCLVALDAPAPPLDDVRGALGKILATTLRAGAIVKRIRQFVTRGETTRQPVEPGTLALEVEELLRDEAVRRGIALRTELAPDLPKVSGDPVQLQQVLVNLVRNAFDAVAAAQSADPIVVMKTAGTADGAVELLVTDNGEGIPAARIAQVFDAYFSTRDHGMGMGLAISRTIIEAHQGTLGVESCPGQSTTFRFTLPAASADDAGTDGLCR